MQNRMPLVEKRLHTEKWFSSDNEFDQIYPLSIQALANRHWTPLAVARKAASFLVAKTGSRILDIGSGVGKFCLAAAYYKPKAYYCGIEQRRSLINHAESIREILDFENVVFTHGNFTQLDFKNFDHFYFYNSFYENLTGTDKIDDSIDYSSELYNYYNCYLHNELDQKPAGTRLVTFHSLEYEIPKNYHEVGAEFDNLLKFWIKA
jgi:SAM-dependent methyltransferase